MTKPLSILCAHGVGHGDIDPDLEGSWSKIICDGLVAWNPNLQGAITCDFLKYDGLFEVPDKIRWTAKGAMGVFISSLLKTNMTPFCLVRWLLDDAGGAVGITQAQIVLKGSMKIVISKTDLKR